MNILKKMSLGKRLVINSILLLAFFAAAILVGFRGLSNAGDAEHLLELRYQQIRALDDLKLMNTELTLLYMDIIIDKEEGTVAAERTEWLKTFKTKLADDEKIVMAAADTEMETKNSADIFKNLKQMLKIGDEELIPAVLNKEEDPAFWVRMDDTLDEVGTKNGELVEKVIESIKNEVEEAKEASGAVKRRVRFNLILLFGVGLIFSILLSYAVRASIVKPVKAMRNRAEDLSSGDVDITQRLALDSDDEIGQLGGWFNKFLDRIQDLVTRIKSSADGLGDSTESILNGGEELAVRTSQQAASITETSSTIEEFTATVKQNSENADGTSQMISAFNDEVQSRRVLIDSVTETMTEIDDSSRKINSIVSVINDISFQTNLLALNAAVEAARAGEAGRGFAVVAAEVRNLAQKTAESSKTIQEIVNQNVESSQKGMGLIKQTSEFFEDILGTLTEMSGSINQIAEGSREQSTGIEQINQTIEQLESVVNQNSALVQEFSATGMNLKKGADELQKQVGRFKGEGEAAAKIPAAPKPPAPTAPPPQPAKAAPPPKKAKDTGGEQDDFFGGEENFEEF